MSFPGAQAEVAALLGRLTGARPILTHISAVYVGPDEVLKLKQAVALGFLDFSTLAAREHFLRREFELNHGFAPGLYRAVAPVVRGANGALALGGEGGAQGVLQSKLAALQAEAQVQQSAATSSFEWRGQSHPVRHERVSVAKPALQASCQPLCMSMLGSI